MIMVVNELISGFDFVLDEAIIIPGPFVVFFFLTLGEEDEDMAVAFAAGTAHTLKLGGGLKQMLNYERRIISYHTDGGLILIVADDHVDFTNIQAFFTDASSNYNIVYTL